MAEALAGHPGVEAVADLGVAGREAARQVAARHRDLECVVRGDEGGRDRLGVHAEVVEPGEAAVEVGVGAERAELLGDPVLDTALGHGDGLAGAGAVAESVERVRSGGLVGEAGLGVGESGVVAAHGGG